MSSVTAAPDRITHMAPLSFSGLLWQQMVIAPTPVQPTFIVNGPTLEPQTPALLQPGTCKPPLPPQPPRLLYQALQAIDVRGL